MARNFGDLVKAVDAGAAHFLLTPTDEWRKSVEATLAKADGFAKILGKSTGSTELKDGLDAVKAAFGAMVAATGVYAAAETEALTAASATTAKIAAISVLRQESARTPAVLDHLEHDRGDARGHPARRRRRRPDLPLRVRPIGEMAQVMLRLAKGDTSVSIRRAEREDEIGLIARAVAVFRDNAVERTRSRRRSRTTTPVGTPASVRSTR